MPKRSNAVALMTAEQAALLRKIAFDAYEPEAFSPNLTKAEAERRIAALQAKLKLTGEPPHVQ
jgi:CRISPR/Cas system-associated protein Cas7 (RAMP superfamily)